MVPCNLHIDSAGKTNKEKQPAMYNLQPRKAERKRKPVNQNLQEKKQKREKRRTLSSCSLFNQSFLYNFVARKKWEPFE
jgi:hypothetical protein